MRSIKTKVITVLFFCILTTSLLVGGAGLVSAIKVVDQDSVQILELYCKDKAQQLNKPLNRVEQTVQIASEFAKAQAIDINRFKTDQDYVDEYTEKMKDVLLNAVNNTSGASAVYIRYNPQFTDPTSGIFYTFSSEQKIFTMETPTDLSKYEPTDFEHVGWYYTPIENDAPTWMAPYWNKNTQTQIISYVIPIKIDNTVIGVVGMDIDYATLTKIVDDVQLYNSGYAFLANSKGDITYHKSYSLNTPLVEIDQRLKPLAVKLQSRDNDEIVTYSFENGDRTAIFEALSNDMSLILSAPTNEINAVRNDLIIQILIITFFVGTFTLIVTYLVTAKMVNPLIKLTEAAKKVADGDLDVAIIHKSKDEIGVLVENFLITVSRLKEYIKHIKELAYYDPMTGVKSKTAYMETAAKLDTQIALDAHEFGIVVFDINNLKNINDSFGHDMGDMQIIAASKLICKSFNNCHVFRIGGDEFVALLIAEDVQNYDMFSQQFVQAMADHNTLVQASMKLTVAYDVAVFDSEKDKSFGDTFKRADLLMYCNKKLTKGYKDTTK